MYDLAQLLQMDNHRVEKGCRKIQHFINRLIIIIKLSSRPVNIRVFLTCRKTRIEIN